MRINFFGEQIVDNINDDLFTFLSDKGLFSSEVYAMVLQGEESDTYSFEIMSNEEGEVIISSTDIFTSVQQACTFVKPHVSQVEVCI